MLLSFSNVPLLGDLDASFIGRSGGGVLGKSGGFFDSQSLKGGLLGESDGLMVSECDGRSLDGMG